MNAAMQRFNQFANDPSTLYTFFTLGILPEVLTVSYLAHGTLT